MATEIKLTTNTGSDKYVTQGKEFGQKVVLKPAETKNK